MTHLEQRTRTQALSTADTQDGLKVLLVEDNLTNQKVALKQLQTLGYRADAVADGQAAMVAITQSHYDLVLMDCQMPIMDGYEATQAIRDWETQSFHPNRIVVIAMTASDLQQDQERAIAVGMDDFVGKPVRRETLAIVLQRWSQVILASRVGFAPTGASVISIASESASESCNPESCKQHLDLESLHLLSDNCPEFELELLQLFTQDCQMHLDLLHQAIAANDLLQVEQSAHYIKGASANVGAKVMHLAAAQLERQSQQKQLQKPDELLAELRESLHYILEFTRCQPS
jgi:CheY-like chemotaxis protein